MCTYLCRLDIRDLKETRRLQPERLLAKSDQLCSDTTTSTVALLALRSLHQLRRRHHGQRLSGPSQRAAKLRGREKEAATIVSNRLPFAPRAERFEPRKILPCAPSDVSCAVSLWPRQRAVMAPPRCEPSEADPVKPDTLSLTFHECSCPQASSQIHAHVQASAAKYISARMHCGARLLASKCCTAACANFIERRIVQLGATAWKHGCNRIPVPRYRINTVLCGGTGIWTIEAIARVP